MNHLHRIGAATTFALLLGLIVLGLSACDIAAPNLTSESEAAEAAPSAMGGFVVLETPDTPGFQVYLIPDPALSTDEGETLILFMHDPSCIPAGFNLVQPPGFASDLADCLTMHTKEWWIPEDLATAGGPWGTPFPDPNFRVPMQFRMDGDAVPVWVVSQAAFVSALDDGVLTIGELEALSRVEGIANRIHAVVQNSNRGSSTPSQRPNHSVWMGNGDLDDGRSFRFHLQERRGEFNHVDLVIE